MGYNKELNQLIQTLNQQEIKSIYKQLKGKTFMTKLFKIYVEQTPPDINKIKKVNNYAVHQNSLKHEILEYLSAYLGNMESIVNPLINKVNVLVDRRIYKEATKLLNSAKAKCAYYEHFARLLTINNLEIMTDNNGYQEKESQLSKLISERQYYIQQLDIETKFIKLFNLLIQDNLNNSQVCRSQVKIQHVQKILIEIEAIYEQYKKKEIELGGFNQMHLYKNLLQLSTKLGHFKKSVEVAKKVLMVFNKFPFLIEVSANAYQNTLIAIVARAALIADTTSFNFGKSKIEELTKQTFRQKTYIRTFYPIAKINYAINSIATNKEITSILNEMIEDYPKIKEHLGRKMVFEYPLRIAKTYLFLGEYNKAEHWLDTAKNAFVKDIEDDVYSAFYLYQLVVYYGQGMYELLPNKVESIQKHLQRTNNIYQVEKCLLKFFKNTDWKDTKQVKNLSTLQENLHKIIGNNPYEKSYWQWHFNQRKSYCRI